jgi:1,6-anhydro-N-acetylmuramate kinase
MGESNRQLALLDHLAHLPQADAAATLGAAVGAVVGTKAASLGEGPLLMAGGAVRHKPLMSAIAKAANRSTRPLKGYQAREAAAMAVLALLELDGVPASLPAVTGRSKAAVPGGLWMRPI